MPVHTTLPLASIRLVLAIALGGSAACSPAPFDGQSGPEASPPTQNTGGMCPGYEDQGCAESDHPYENPAGAPHLVPGFPFATSAGHCTTSTPWGHVCREVPVTQQNWDLNCDAGDPIGSMVTGRVTRADDGDPDQTFTGYGVQLCVEEAETKTTVCMNHLQAGSLMVGVGDEIKQGRLVATCGDTGQTTGAHVDVYAYTSAGELYRLPDPDMWAPLADLHGPPAADTGEVTEPDAPPVLYVIDQGQTPNPDAAALWLIDPATGAELDRYPVTDQPTDVVAFSGGLVVAAGDAGVVDLIDPATGETRSLPFDCAPVSSAAALEDLVYGLCGDGDLEVRAYSLAQDRLVHAFIMPDYVTPISVQVVERDGDAAVLVATNESLTVLSAADLSLLASTGDLTTFEAPGSFTDLAFDADRARALLLENSGSIRVVDLSGGATWVDTWSRPSETTARRLWFDTAQDALVVTAWGDAEATLTVLDAGSGNLVTEIHTSNRPHAIGPDVQQGRAWVTDIEGNTLMLWDLQQGDIVRTVQVGGSPVDLVLLGTD